MGADYQEITLTPGPVVPTGHFALYVFPVGAGGGAVNVTLVPNTGLNAQTLSTTPLVRGDTFNSAAFDFNNSILGFTLAMAFSDQPSATNGFMVQQSIDGINWDLNSAVASVLANIGLGIKAAQTVRFARIQYTNNASTGQIIFRLGARFSIA